MPDKLEFIATLEDKTRAALDGIVKNHKAAADALKKHNADVVTQTKAQNKAYTEVSESLGKIKNTVSGALTPAMASLGIASLGVGSALDAVVKLLQKAGASYNTLNDAARRSGTSASYITAMTVAMERLGIAASQVPDYIASMGDHLARIQRGAPQELNALTGTFRDMLPIIRETLKGSTSAEDRITRLLKLASQHPEIPVDKWMKFYEAIGGPASLGTKNAEEVGKALTAGADYIAKHPPDIALYGKLNDTFSKLRESLNGFGDDMVRIFGPKGIEVLSGFSEATAGMAKKVEGELRDVTAIFGAIKSVLELDDKISGGVKKFLGVGADPFATIAQGKVPALGSGSDTEAVTKGTKEGMLQALREYAMGRASDAELFAGGYKPMAYHPGGGGGGMFGSKEYPAVGGEESSAGSIGRGAGARGGGGAGGGAPTAGGQGGMIPDTAGAGTSSYLQGQRARFGEELKSNPELRKKLAALTTLEGNPANVTESLMNRMEMTGGSLKQGMSSGFYGPINRGQLPGAMAALERDPKKAAHINAAIDSVLAGRNVLRGATDQGMRGDPNAKWQGGSVPGLDQIYNDWGGGGGHDASRRFRENQQRNVLAGEGQKAHGANVREFIGRGRKGETDGQLLQQGMKAVDAGTAHTLDINMNGLPRGATTKYAGQPGLFKEVKLNRGRPMAPASQDS